MYKLETKFLIAQKVNDPLPWGTLNPTYLLLPSPSPSDLDNDNTLDIEEKTGISDTTETLQIDKTFVAISDIYQDYYVKEILFTKGVVRAVVGLGVAGDGTNTTYLTKITIDVGYIDNSGSFTSKGSNDATPNVSTSSTSYTNFSAQTFIDLDLGFRIPENYRFASRIRVYGYVSAGTGGKIKIRLARGEVETYLELALGLLGQRE